MWSVGMLIWFVGVWSGNIGRCRLWNWFYLWMCLLDLGWRFVLFVWNFVNVGVEYWSVVLWVSKYLLERLVLSEVGFFCV